MGGRQVRLLLDTHIWLWSLLDPERLGPRTRAAIDDPDHEKWLSPVSVWEPLVLAERGRLALEPDPESWARVHLARLPLQEAPLTAEVAIASRRLRIGSTDPADRFLAASALVYELTLVTADARLREIDGVDVLPNT
jgi:PIN domain nuclease of toxin-antitoxin system